MIYTSTVPAELIVTQGADGLRADPRHRPALREQHERARLRVHRQSAGVRAPRRPVVHGAGDATGRGRTCPAIRLPADFRRIPLDSPVEPVLASVPGTPQAAEAVIENSVPQTGAVSRSAPDARARVRRRAAVRADRGTRLQYVVNAPVPVIRVSSNSYFAVYNGVWFARAERVGAVDRRGVRSGGDLHDPAEFAALLRHVRAGVRRDGHRGVRRLHAGLLRHGRRRRTAWWCTAPATCITPWVGAYYYPPPMTYGFGATVRWTPWTGWSVGLRIRLLVRRRRGVDVLGRRDVGGASVLRSGVLRRLLRRARLRRGRAGRLLRHHRQRVLALRRDEHDDATRRAATTRTPGTGTSRATARRTTRRPASPPPASAPPSATPTPAATSRTRAAPRRTRAPGRPPPVTRTPTGTRTPASR